MPTLPVKIIHTCVPGETQHVAENHSVHQSLMGLEQKKSNRQERTTSTSAKVGLFVVFPHRATILWSERAPKEREERE